PTVLSAEQLGALLQVIAEQVDIEPDCEFTIEANPGTLDPEKTAALREAGVNRISLGAQSFRPETLQKLGRIHGPDEIFQAVEMLRKHGFQNIGLDLIYAVPGQTLEQWSADLDAAIGLGTQHISTYGLTFDQDTEFEERLNAGSLQEAPEELYLQMYYRARERLMGAGFEHYEISNFALPGFESAHNCNYWLNGRYLGIGAGATTFAAGRRYDNVQDIEEYIELIQSRENAVCSCEHKLEPEDFACETAAFNIRYLPGIDRQSFRERTGYDLDELFADVIDHHVELGLLAYDGKVLRLTPEALGVADSISEALVMVCEEEEGDEEYWPFPDPSS
ncbi:MAG: radical SAM family heme chaperone HemW, partial [Planctomycetes bacterium]|nr:radical SAM family heme chaperone HemW [Planctomycetota bacterium]